MAKAQKLELIGDESGQEASEAELDSVSGGLRSYGGSRYQGKSSNLLGRRFGGILGFDDEEEEMMMIQQRILE